MFGQIRRPRSECMTNVLQCLLFPLSNCGTPHLAPFPPGLVSIRRFSQVMVCPRARPSL
jgi:hypothetical protein